MCYTMLLYIEPGKKQRLENSPDACLDCRVFESSSVTTLLYGDKFLTFIWREWQPTPVFLSGELYGQRGLVDHSPWCRKKSDKTEQLTHPHTCTHTDPASRARGLCNCTQPLPLRTACCVYCSALAVVKFSVIFEQSPPLLFCTGRCRLGAGPVYTCLSSCWKGLQELRSVCNLGLVCRRCSWKTATATCIIVILLRPRILSGPEHYVFYKLGG